MPKKNSNTGTNVAVIVAVIGLTGTIITALLSSPLLLKVVESPPTETPVLPANAALIFSEDFEDGVASGFGFVSDNWSVGKDRSNKVLVADSTPYTPDQWTTALFGPTDFSDGVIEFKMKYEKIGGMYTVFRLREGAEYMFYFTGVKAILAYNSSAQDWNLTPFSDDTVQVFSARENVWYAVRIEARGARITVYIDGNKLFTGEDARLQSGSIQFNMDYGAKVLLDDVKVWAFGK